MLTKQRQHFHHLGDTDIIPRAHTYYDPSLGCFNPHRTFMSRLMSIYSFVIKSVLFATKATISTRNPNFLLSMSNYLSNKPVLLTWYKPPCPYHHKWDIWPVVCECHWTRPCVNCVCTPCSSLRPQYTSPADTKSSQYSSKTRPTDSLCDKSDQAIYAHHSSHTTSSSVHFCIDKSASS